MESTQMMQSKLLVQRRVTAFSGSVKQRQRNSIWSAGLFVCGHDVVYPDAIMGDVEKECSERRR